MSLTVPRPLDRPFPIDSERMEFFTKPVMHMGHGLSGHSNSSSAASQTVINQRRVWGQSAKLLRNSSMTPRVGKELDDKIDFILFGPRK